MLQTLELASAAWLRTAAARLPRIRKRGYTGLELVEVEGGEFTIGARRRRLRVRQRAPAPPRGRARLPDRPHAGHERRLVDVRRPVAATSGVSGGRPRAGRGGETTTSRDRRAGRLTCAPIGVWADWSHSPPSGPSSTFPGSRPTRSRAPTRSGCRPRPSGNERGLGIQGGEASAALPVGRRAARPRRARQRRSAVRRNRAGRDGWTPEPRRAAASACSATSGSGPAADFGGYPGFVADPYREYSEVFFGGDYRVLRGGSWATRARVISPTFRNWDYPQRRQIFAGVRIAADA